MANCPTAKNPCTWHDVPAYDLYKLVRNGIKTFM